MWLLHTTLTAHAVGPEEVKQLPSLNPSRKAQECIDAKGDSSCSLNLLLGFDNV